LTPVQELYKPGWALKR